MFQLATRRTVRTAIAPPSTPRVPGRATLVTAASDDATSALERDLAALTDVVLPQYLALMGASVESLQHEIARSRAAMRVRCLITACTARLHAVSSVSLRTRVEAVVARAHAIGVYAGCS